MPYLGVDENSLQKTMNASSKTSSESMISLNVDNDKVCSIENALERGKQGFIMHYVIEQSKLAQIGVELDVLPIEGNTCAPENEIVFQQTEEIKEKNTVKRKSPIEEKSLFPIRQIDKESRTNFANRISVFHFSLD